MTDTPAAQDAPVAGVVESAMRHALSISAHGPVTGVNPQVGCVILGTDGRMLAEGWHRGAGTPHAEVDALNNLQPGEAVGATAVVTLEPCDHSGCTGPCSVALIEAGIAEVYYGATDPGRDSRGGAERLRNAGVKTTGGVLGAEVEDFLHVWLTATRLGRPYVTLKWAASLDGRAAAQDGSSQWITGTTARQHVHELREASDAVIVGTGTALADDPSLTARGDAGELMEHQPVPVVLGMRTVPDSARLRAHPQPLLQFPGHDLAADLKSLFDRGIRRVLVEGGPTLASAFVRDGLVDDYRIYLAPTLIGGPATAIGDLGVSGIAESLRLTIRGIESLGDDLLISARPLTRAIGVRALRPAQGTTQRNTEEA